MIKVNGWVSKEPVRCDGCYNIFRLCDLEKETDDDGQLIAMCNTCADTARERSVCED